VVATTRAHGIQAGRLVVRRVAGALSIHRRFSQFGLAAPTLGVNAVCGVSGRCLRHRHKTGAGQPADSGVAQFRRARVLNDKTEKLVDGTADAPATFEEGSR
jgi:hypothetical protein